MNLLTATPAERSSPDSPRRKLRTYRGMCGGYAQPIWSFYRNAMRKISKPLPRKIPNLPSVEITKPGDPGIREIAQRICALIYPAILFTATVFAQKNA